MRCREARKLLVAYLDSEVAPSERVLIETHLAGCCSCAGELSALISCRGRVTDCLKTMATHAKPSSTALHRLLASITEETRTPPATRFRRREDRRMKVGWRIAFGAVGAVMIAAVVIGVVPSARAAAGEFFAGIFSISGKESMFKLNYLPVGFDSEPVYQSGSGSVLAGDSELDPSGVVNAVVEEKEVHYRNGDLLLVVHTSACPEQPLPEGQPVQVNGYTAVLRTGLAGDVPGHGAPSAEHGPGEEVVSWVSGGLDDDGRYWSESGERDRVPPARYQNANALTWDVGGARVEILTNLPAEELLKVAEGLHFDE